MGTTPLPSAAVVIPTYRRATYVRTCLEHLLAQTVAPVEIAVVDASPDDETRQVVAEFPGVRYLRNPFGRGTTATSRSIGVHSVSAEVIAFVDDDAYARPDWLEQLLQEYADPRVGAVGGRVSNGRPGEELVGLDEIGRIHEDGTLVGNFSADPGHALDVDHLLGANMSYRAEAIAQVGGIHDGYRGNCMREETDIALRVRRAGWRLRFTPAAVVDHVEGPYATGRRFGVRYTYYGQRNHLVLLSRIFGPRSPELRGYLAVGGEHMTSEARRSVTTLARLPQQRSMTDVRRTARGAASGAARSVAVGAGMAVGLVAGALHLRRDRLETGRRACASS